MTVVISVLTFFGRAAGTLLTSTMGWAANLLFGRVPRSHQVFVNVLMGCSLLWVATVIAFLLPGVPGLLLDTTPHPGFIGIELVRLAIFGGLILLPAFVGLAGYLIPAPEERERGLGIVRQILMGYPLALAMAGILVFLAGVALIRKVRSARHGWSESHVPIVVKNDGYEKMVVELERALAGAGLPVRVSDAPWILAVPSRILAALAGRNVSGLIPDRLNDLDAPGLHIALYPSDIAISGKRRQRTLTRATVLHQLVWTSAWFTTSSEAQAIEDRIARVAMHGLGQAAASSRSIDRELDAIDRSLLEVDLSDGEWDVLYRLRIQVERDLIAERQTPVSAAIRPDRAALTRSA